MRFRSNGEVEIKARTRRDSEHCVFTLSEARIKRTRAVHVHAVGDWLQAQIHYLVEAELPTVDGCGLRFQGDEQLLWTVGRHQTSLEEKHRQEHHVYLALIKL